MPTRHLPRQHRGFALVVTISLMVLLTLVGLGLMTLSSISLRSSGANAAVAEARANARIAMLMALAQLQTLTGHDTRVTATSDLISAANVPVTGAWRSWEGSDREASGKPKAPDYGSKRLPADPAKPTAPTGEGRFLGWLTSTALGVPPNVSSIPNISKAPVDGSVPMVSTGSVTDPSRQVHIKPIPVQGGSGTLAWWTSGENAKAMINADRMDDPTSVVAWHQRVKSNGRPDPKSFGLEKLNDFPKNRNVPSTGGLRLVNPAAELRKIHDLTAYSRGLLTNTAAGGWRKDLSLFSERFSALPDTGLPLYTRSPGNVQTYSKAQPSSVPPNPVIYPWATYRNNGNGSGWQQVPPICSWNALVDYMLQYQSLSTSSASRTAMPSFVGSLYGAENRYDYQDKVRRCPQIARIHWIYSLCSTPLANSNPATYRPALMVTPVLTLWNPYNVEIEVSNFAVNIQETAPLRFKFKVDSTVYPETSLTQITKRASAEYQRFKLTVNQSIVLPPGASRVFGLNDATPKDGGNASNVALAPGYRPNGGYLFYGLNAGSDIPPATAAAVFEIDQISYDAVTVEGGKSGIGIIYDISMISANGGSASKSAHRMIYDVNELGGQAVIASLYPPLTSKLSTTLGDVEGIKNQPFASAIFSYRMASPMSRDPKHRHLYSKGMLQANPLCYYTEIGFGDTSAAITAMAGTGVYHPINAPYDFAFQDVLGGWNDTLSIPEYERGTNSSYIVSGLSAGDGLTRCVMAELPTRPVQSLAELQHFDARNNNPITPFQFNLIGNGSAHPVFAPNQISVSTTYNNGMCNDDTFILNHLFFDDWFVSSIAPDLQDFSATAKRPIKSVYKDHLTLATPLPNRFYLPARGADIPGGKSAPDPDKAADEVLAAAKDGRTGMFPFETVASKLEVEGMFNINSISPDAWKALLRQSRDLEVPSLAANGNTKGGKASSFSYPRTSIAGDEGTNSGSRESSATFPDAAHYAGHRVLTEEQIDALAEEIIKEIRKRGPFLSLAEFVNRQLTSDEDLAIAATIQKALDTLAESGNSPKNPFSALQGTSVQITPSSLPAGTTDYKFAKAALGWSAFGVPGWVRQADILKPISPILSARDDTFTVRAYGDSRDRSNQIVARAWCEGIVKRTPSYVDPADPAAVAPHSARITSAANKRFGRRYDIVSFRWLNEREI